MPNRVKSGMFSERVDQKAIMAIKDGKNTGQNLSPQPRVPGSLTIGPRPPAWEAIQMNRKTATTRTNGAAQFSNRRMKSIPRTMTKTLRAQKMMKLSHRVQGCVAN